MRRSMLSLIIGVLVAGAAVFLIANYVQSPRAVQAGVGVQMASLVVATKDMPFGTPVSKESLQTVQWPKTSVPDGAFASIDEVFAGATDDAQRVALRLIGKGEPVLKGKVSGFGERATLSRRVASDKRAVSIRINDVSGVSGFLLPGDRVDVMLTRQIGDGRDNQVTDIILQDITVLGIDQLSDDGTDKPVVARTATVEASPEEAQKLALAQELGSLSLALRNAMSAEAVPTSRIAARDLTSEKPLGRPTQAAPSVRIRYQDGSVVTREVHP